MRRKRQPTHRIAKVPAVPVPSGDDATIERLAKDESAIIPSPEGEGSGSRLQRVRQIVTTQLIREHRAGNITLVQRQAGERYVELHHTAHTTPSIIANYAPTIPSGSPVYGHLARSEHQLHARRELAKVDAHLHPATARFATVFLILDRLPRCAGNQRAAQIKHIRQLLDRLTEWRS